VSSFVIPLTLDRQALQDGPKTVVWEGDLPGGGQRQKTRDSNIIIIIIIIRMEDMRKITIFDGSTNISLYLRKVLYCILYGHSCNGMNSTLYCDLSNGAIWQINMKSYIICRIVPFYMTLNDH